LLQQASPNYQDAYYQFQLAYQESAKSWKVLGNLGLCALKLERDEEAVSYYEQYLDKGGSEIPQEERSAIEQDLLLLKGNLATVKLTSVVQDLKVTDQRAGSSAPAQPYALSGGALELKLRAGNHTITAFNGNQPLTWTAVLEPRGVASHEFDFNAPSRAETPAAASAPASATGAPTTPDADRPGQPGQGMRTGAYVAFGVAAVGLGLGGYFLYQSADYREQSDRAFSCDARPGGCSATQQSEVRHLEADSGSAQTRGVVTLGLGGAALAAGIVLLALSPSSRGAAQRAQLLPYVGYRELGVSGRF
jgi:hypothetical protein